MKNVEILYFIDMYGIPNIPQDLIKEFFAKKETFFTNQFEAEIPKKSIYTGHFLYY